jgi:hypothetical protein
MDERVVSALHDVAVHERVRRARYYHVEGPNFPAAVLEVTRTPMTLSQPYPDALG